MHKYSLSELRNKKVPEYYISTIEKTLADYSAAKQIVEIYTLNVEDQIKFQQLCQDANEAWLKYKAANQDVTEHLEKKKLDNSFMKQFINKDPNYAT